MKILQKVLGKQLFSDSHYENLLKNISTLRDRWVLSDTSLEKKSRRSAQ